MPDKKNLFATIHSDYHVMVLQLCLGFMKGDMDLAKDLSQEVFINTWKALNKFRNASSYKTWIYRITVNTCLKSIRDKKDKYQIPINEEHFYHPDESIQSLDTPHQSLYMAIGQLREVDRLIMMMILDDLEYEEISKIIGISEGNLRVKISRIKKNIKKIIENE